MERVCFRLQLKLDRLDEYIERHAEVWPEMLAALTETGWTNYSLFVDERDGTLIGYLETPDLAAAQESEPGDDSFVAQRRQLPSTCLHLGTMFECDRDPVLLT